MDDALKARLIGATILVALAVLQIPELLSERKPAELAAGAAKETKGTRSFTIELGGSPQGPAAAQPEATPPAPTPATTPAPAPAPTETAPQAEGPTAATPLPTKTPEAAPDQTATAKPASGQAAPPREAAPAPTPPPAPATTASANPTRGGWAVQVGAFSSSDTASKLAKKLKAAGYTVYVSPITRSGKPLYRVRVGPVAERPGAEALVGGLKAQGLPATVVAND